MSLSHVRVTFPLYAIFIFSTDDSESSDALTYAYQDLSSWSLYSILDLVGNYTDRSEAVCLILTLSPPTSLGLNTMDPDRPTRTLYIRLQTGILYANVHMDETVQILS
jgi:hypothetical protein